MDKKETRKTCINVDEKDLRLNKNVRGGVCAGRVTALLIFKPIHFIGYLI